MKTKIVYIVDNLTIGGAQTQLARLVDGLEHEDFSIKVICLGKYDSKLVDTIGTDHIYFLKMDCIWTWPFWNSYRKMKAILKAEQPGIVHTYLNTANVFGCMAAKKVGVPIIIGSRRDMGHFRSKRIAAMEKRANKFCRKIICVSNAVKEKTIKEEGLDNSKVEVLYGGIDTAYFDLPDKQRPENTCFTVGMVATMDRPMKGHQDLLQAAKSVVKQRMDVKFVLVGDGSLRSSLEDYVKTNGLEKHVEFVGKQDDIRGEVLKMDALVLPSHSEGFSNAVLESMALKVPVIAYALEGNLEIIEDRVTGLLVQPRDTADLVEKILYLLDHPDERIQMGEKARNRILDRFTISHMVNRYKDFYHSLIDMRVGV